MIDLMTVNVGVPNNIFQQAFLYALNNSPEGPVTQFYYLSARLYRCVSNAVNSLPPFSESAEEAELPSSCERISIVAIKAEVDEMVRRHVLSSRARLSLRELLTSECDASETLESLNGDTDLSARSFQFLNDTEFECSVSFEDEWRFVDPDGTLPPDMDEFVELLVSCAKEVELQC